MILSLAEAKLQLRIDFDDDDDLLAAKLAAAQAFVERLLGFSIETAFGGGDQEPVPEPLREAVLQLVAAWYERREAVAVDAAPAEMPFSLAAIVREYRNWSF